MSLPLRRAVFDLNSECLFGHAGSAPREGATHAGWQNGLRAVDGFHSHARISALCESLWRQLQSQHIFLLGPIALYGFCAIDRPRRFARNRNLSARLGPATVSRGGARPRLAQHARRRQRNARLSDLRRPGASSDCHGALLVRRRKLRGGVAADRLRPRLHHHRSVPGAFSLGTLSRPKCGRQDAYAARSAGQHSCLHGGESRENPRDSHPRRTSPRTRLHLSDGPRLLGFCPPLRARSGAGFLRHPRAQGFCLSSPRLASRRQDDWPPLRSDHSPEKLLSGPVLSSTLAAHSLSRRRNRQDPHLSHQPFFLPALIIVQLYKCRWQVELFFKWIKQHLRIKKFYGLSPNAVKTQIWIAISVYVLLAIVRKHLKLELNLYPMSQILSLSLFEKTPLLQVFSQINPLDEPETPCNQLNLFDL